MEAEKTQSSQPAQSFDIYKLMAWFHANRKVVITGVLTVAVVATGIALSSWKQGQNEMAASEALSAVPGIIGGGEKAVHPSSDALLKIANEYPGTSAGQRAHLMAAETLFTEGKYDQAQTQFSKFLAEHSNSPLAAQASIGVAASIEAQGKTADAIQKYQDVVTKYANSGVAAPAKLTLARLYEEQNKPDQALKSYDDLVRSAMPYDPWASEARERRETLLTKHPELKPAPTAPPVVPPSIAPASAAKPAPAANVPTNSVKVKP